MEQKSRRLRTARLTTKSRTLCVLHGSDDESESEGEARQTPSAASRTSSSHSAENARTPPHASPVQELVPTLCGCVWSWSQHPTSRKKSW